MCVFAGLHGVPLYVLALVALSLGRFINAALSAGQPHVVSASELPTANAFSTTAGTVATTLGGAAALLLRIGVGDNNHGYGILGFCAPVFYLISGSIAGWFAKDALGPDEDEKAARESASEVARGLRDAARHVHARPEVQHFLTAIGMVRLCHGITTVCTVLLYRNYFVAEGAFRSGLGGLLQIVIATAIGGAIGALITPTAIRRIGMHRWSVLLIAMAGVVQLTLFLPYQIQLYPFAFVLTSISSQGVKLCTDTVIQRDVDDRFRGRVFSFYDALFNIALVIASLLVSLGLPEDGHAPVAVVVLAAIYFATSGWFAYQRRSSSIAAS